MPLGCPDGARQLHDELVVGERHVPARAGPRRHRGGFPRSRPGGPRPTRARAGPSPPGRSTRRRAPAAVGAAPRRSARHVARRPPPRRGARSRRAVPVDLLAPDLDHGPASWCSIRRPRPDSGSTVTPAVGVPVVVVASSRAIASRPAPVDAAQPQASRWASAGASAATAARSRRGWRARVPQLAGLEVADQHVDSPTAAPQVERHRLRPRHVGEPGCARRRGRGRRAAPPPGTPDTSSRAGTWARTG